MKLFYGHFPSLEEKFLEFTFQNRHNPLSKWLVIVSSSLVARELQKQLTAKTGVLANIHFITVGGLIDRLDFEAGGNLLPLFPQDHLRDFLIKEILTQPGLDRYPVSGGFVRAVKSSLRDMADSLVEPDVLEEHVLSMPQNVLEQEGDRLLWLTRVYRRYRECESQIPGYRSYQQAFERALTHISCSAYLHEFESIIWYGFYELSGRQLEVFNELKAYYPLTVFAAYQKHPAYQFAKKFFETNWLSLPSSEPLPQRNGGALGESASFLFASGGSAPCGRTQIVSAMNQDGEIFYTAKEILKLVEKEGYSFKDIAVVARTLTPYQDALRNTFAANKIPLNASFSYPLSHYALGNFCAGVLDIANVGFERNAVLQLVSSPYFKHPDKVLWGGLIRRSLVNRDLAQWNDLLPLTKGYDPALLKWLNQLSEQLKVLSDGGSWKQHVSCAVHLLKEIVNEEEFEGKDAEIFSTVCSAIEKISAYQSVRSTCAPGEFLREVKEALSSLVFNEAENIPGGVTCVDALRARGLQFKIVFVLGLNDQSFPLVTPEDPILRDYYRYILRDVLGYWINQSLERADEEKLLFYTTLTAAREKLYVTYYRRNMEGKEAVPSVYIAELARACQLNLHASDAPRVSGHLQEQLFTTDVSLLTAKEISYLCVLDPSGAQAHLAQTGLLTSQKEQSLTAAHLLRQSGPLHAMDGIICSGEQLFGTQNKKGFSPSALQELAACPLKYFFDKGLNLSEEDEPLSRHTLSADRKGNAYHEILNEFYNTLYQKHLTHSLFDQGAIEYLDRALEKHYTNHSYRLFGIYPVVWELILENIRQKLIDFVTEDLKQLGSFTPSRFEMEVEMEPNQELPLRLNGIIDRLDLDEDTKQFFVVDYKSSRKGTKNLASDLFTHLIFQPFLYVFIGLHLRELQNYTSAGSCLLSIQPQYDKRVLDASSFEDLRPRAIRFFMQITDLIKAGTFFICPSDLCTYCSYSTLCRRDCFASLMRARKSAIGQALEEARR